jgi:transketolase
MTTVTRQPAKYEQLPELIALMTGDEKHTIAASSTIDVIWTLYDRILRVDPAAPSDPNRDRFLLSKGHGPMAFYAVLAAKGFIPRNELAGYATYNSRLGHHPDATLLPGVEIGSGSLGHGLPIAVGLSIGLNALGSSGRVFVLLGDGELDEGSNHEAIVVAGRRGLDRLTAIVVDNQSATQGWPGGIDNRFALEGWATSRVNGRDHDAIERALRTDHGGRPLAVVALVERR